MEGEEGGYGAKGGGVAVWRLVMMAAMTLGRAIVRGKCLGDRR